MIWTAILMAGVLATTTGVIAFLATRRMCGQWLDADGARLHYTDEGAGAPVVLLHGFAVNADLNWRLLGITAALVRGFRVIALDLRGHGLSDKPHDPGRYGMEMLEDIPRLLDHLGIERAHVVGYSLGGIITLKLAATHPERLLSAAVLGAGWETPVDSPLLEAMEALVQALKQGRGIRPLAAHLGPGRERPGIMHTLLVWFMTRFVNDGLALAAMIRALPKLAVDEADLGRIPVPVLSIVGERDPLRPEADALEGRIPDLTRVLIRGADHIRTLWRREFRTALIAFLQRQVAGEAGVGGAPDV
jgi:pimeloyl-ACP methyl ester carboxylesterase